MSTLFLNTLPSSDNPKFYHISRYKIENQIEPVITNSSSKFTIVIFCFWNVYYIKLAYISLYCLLKHTDAKNFDIKIVTHHNIEKEVREVFASIIGNDNIILNSPYKYDIFNNVYIKNKTKVVFVDADGFVLADKKTLFKNIFESKSKVLMFKETATSIKNMLINRKTIIKTAISLLTQLKNKNNWYLSGLSAYSTEIFKQDYKEYCEEFIKHNCTDDEAVFLNYITDKITDISKYVKWFRGGQVLAFAKNTFPAFIHMIEGDFLLDKFIPIMLDKILKNKL